MRPELVHRLCFWAFCSIVFSKIVWYDLRVYMAPEDRRSFLAVAFSIWTLLQLALYVWVARSLLARLDRRVFAWIVAVAPFFLAGALYGQLNFFFVTDLVRYSIPIGFYLFGRWSVARVPARSMTSALVVSMAVYILLRTVLHHLMASQFLRYGVVWEALFPASLVALAAGARGWRYLGVLAALAGTIYCFAQGQTRSVLFGTVIVGALGLLASMAPTAGHRRARLRIGVAGAVAAGLALAPMILPRFGSPRIQIAGLIEDSRSVESRVERRAGRRESPGSEAPGEGRFPTIDLWPDAPSRGQAERSSEIDEALRRWEASMTGDRSLSVRLAEARYYLTVLVSDPGRFVLGAGAGDFVVVETPLYDRIVRGAHNTFVTLLHRHGVLLGPFLFVLVSFYGLGHHLPQLRRSPDGAWRTLLFALVLYRVAAFAMAQFHQGLFDDPIVFLSIAIASAGRNRPGAPDPATASPRGRPGKLPLEGCGPHFQPEWGSGTLLRRVVLSRLGRTSQPGRLWRRLWKKGCQGRAVRSAG